eukprot:scaffold65213_cov39-Cyclotella_meneghiniana.AAC.4
MISFIEFFKRKGVARYTGENVLVVQEELLGVCRRLDAVGALTDEHVMDILTGLSICGNSRFRKKYEHLKQGAEFNLLPLEGVTMYSSPLDKIEAILDNAATTYSSFCLANQWLKVIKQNIAGVVATVNACWNCGEEGHGVGKCTKPKDQARITKNKEAFEKNKSGRNTGGGGRTSGKKDKNKKTKDPDYQRKVWANSGISMVNGVLMIHCKTCGYNTTHGTKLHEAWASNPTSFRLSESHMYEREKKKLGQSGRNPMVNPSTQPQPQQSTPTIPSTMISFTRAELKAKLSAIERTSTNPNESELSDDFYVHSTFRRSSSTFILEFRPVYVSSHQDKVKRQNAFLREVPSATKLWNRHRKADAKFLGANVGSFKPFFDHGVVPEEVLDSFVVDRGNTFLAGIRLLQQFEHESLAKSATETVHRLNLFGVNLGLHDCQGEHGKQRQRITAKDCPLVWDTGASFGLTPFRSDFIDYTECNIPVNDIARTNIVIGLGTTLHRFELDGKAFFLPCLSYHLPSAEIRLFSPQTYHTIYGGYSHVKYNSVQELSYNHPFSTFYYLYHLQKMNSRTNQYKLYLAFIYALITALLLPRSLTSPIAIARPWPTAHQPMRRSTQSSTTPQQPPPSHRDGSARPINHTRQPQTGFPSLSISFQPHRARKRSPPPAPLQVRPPFHGLTTLIPPQICRGEQSHTAEIPTCGAPLSSSVTAPKCVNPKLVPKCTSDDAPKCASSKNAEPSLAWIRAPPPPKSPAARPIKPTFPSPHKSTIHHSPPSIMPTMSSNSTINAAATFSPGTTTGQPNHRGNKALSYTAAVTKTATTNNNLSTKLATASLVSNSKTVKKTKLSTHTASAIGSPGLTPPSPVKKMPSGPFSRHPLNNKRMQLTSPSRDFNTKMDASANPPPPKPSTPHSSLPSKKLDFLSALKSSSPPSSTASSSSDDTMEKMLADELRRNASAFNLSNNSSDESSTSEEVRACCLALRAKQKERKASSRYTTGSTTSSLNSSSSIISPPSSTHNNTTSTDAHVSWENLTNADDFSGLDGVAGGLSNGYNGSYGAPNGQISINDKFIPNKSAVDTSLVVPSTSPALRPSRSPTTLHTPTTTTTSSAKSTTTSSTNSTKTLPPTFPPGLHPHLR